MPLYVNLHLRLAVFALRLQMHILGTRLSAATVEKMVPPHVHVISVKHLQNFKTHQKSKKLHVSTDMNSVRNAKISRHLWELMSISLQRATLQKL